MTAPAFKFWSYVKSDLVRASVLSSGNTNLPGGLRLWRGILSPRFMPVLLCRTAYALFRYRLTPLAKLVSLLNFVLFGIEISLQCDIGKGLFLPHTQGTVIGANSIGDNAIIFQGVTLGSRELDIGYKVESRPVLGSNVVIGSGAKILGGIEIGDNARVGANSVVLINVPANTTVAGVPAKIVKTPDAFNEH